MDGRLGSVPAVFLLDRSFLVLRFWILGGIWGNKYCLR